MQGHVRTLGYLYIIFAAILALIGACMFLVIGGSGLFSGDRHAALITGGVGLFVAMIFLLIAIPAFIAGWGLLRFRPWARVLAIVVGVLNILNFPFGTALGVYTLWVLLNAETQPLFAPTSA